MYESEANGKSCVTCTALEMEIDPNMLEINSFILKTSRCLDILGWISNIMEIVFNMTRYS